MRVLLATRSAHKLEEISEILSELDLGGTAGSGVELVGLDDIGLAPSPEEDELEPHDTFEENALSKARWYAAKSGLPTLSDDSGLEVDALDGAPGVRSKRFSPPAVSGEVDGQARDDANNAHLLDLLDGVPEPDRAARYVCVVAWVGPDGQEMTVRGEVEGRIAEAPSGSGGFGYDPLFFVPELGQTFGTAPAEAKHARSHRGRAFRAIVPTLRAAAARPGA
jgi:XTP/dITP diphosphohydrolase